MLACAIRILVPSLRGASGIATYTESLAYGLAAAGHEVVLLDQTAGFQTADPRITVVRLRPARRLPYPFEPLAEWGLRGEVRRLAREFTVDGIHATQLGLVPSGEASVVTVWDPLVSPVGRLRAASWRGEARLREAMYGVIDAVAARRSRGIVAVTASARAGFARFGRRCELVPPFLDDETIVPPRPERSHDVVMVAGALDLPRKGLDLALAAVARLRATLPGVRLVLVGDWIDASRVASLPDFCRTVGRLAPDGVMATLGSAGCCLIPSRWEEFGYSGLEALATGTPVACAPLPGYAGISGGGVFMAASRDPDEVAARLLAALEARTFSFPRECRRSVAIPRILDLYKEAFAG